MTAFDSTFKQSICNIETEFENLLTSFWILLGEAESKAENENDPVLKHQVAQFYKQWNRHTGHTHKPRWLKDGPTDSNGNEIKELWVARHDHM